MRRLPRALSLVASIVAAGCSAPQLGELPARCSEGACPEGYACIHEICARPGTEIPSTVARLEALRDLDLKLVPQATGVLVTWLASSHDGRGKTFVGARVTAQGDVSEPMALVTGVKANDASEAPCYDVIGLSGDRLLLAVGAPPLSQDDVPAPRLLMFRVQLPPEGDEARGAQFEAAWPSEQRLETAGRGAPFRPKLLARGGDRVDLGYVRSSRRAETDGKPQTIAELTVSPLHEDGSVVSPARAYRARQGMSIAVAVVDAFSLEGAAWWVLDDIRPSAVLVPDQGMPGETPQLHRFGTAVDADRSSLTYINPSERTGNKLAASRVEGFATLQRVRAEPVGEGLGWAFDETPAGELGLGELTLRDTPRPVWVARDGKPPLLVTPGADIDAPALLVYEVDPGRMPLTPVRRIERLSSARIGGTRALVVGRTLFVAWIDATDVASTIRMAVVPEP